MVSRRTVREAKARRSPGKVHEFVCDVLGDDVHATRVLSLARGVIGVVHAAALGVHTIGRGLADAMGLDAKHATQAHHIARACDPLLSKTVDKRALRNRRSDYEPELIERLHEILPKAVDVTLLADRGFADQKLFTYLDILGWRYVARFRQGIQRGWLSTRV